MRGQSNRLEYRGARLSRLAGAAPHHHHLPRHGEPALVPDLKQANALDLKVGEAVITVRTCQACPTAAAEVAAKALWYSPPDK